MFYIGSHAVEAHKLGQIPFDWALCLDCGPLLAFRYLFFFFLFILYIYTLCALYFFFFSRAEVLATIYGYTLRPLGSRLKAKLSRQSINNGNNLKPRFTWRMRNLPFPLHRFPLLARRSLATGFIDLPLWQGQLRLFSNIEQWISGPTFGIYQQNWPLLFTEINFWPTRCIILNILNSV